MAKMPDYDYLLIGVMIGDSGVGKSCLLLRYADDKWTDSYISTIGVDFKIRTIEHDQKRLKLQMWDTAGQERFRTISSTYYKGAHFVMVVYDVTNRQSFDNVGKWFTEVRKYGRENVILLLVGNKADLADKSGLRQVSQEEGQAYADKEKNCKFIEVDAKAGTNVDAAFLLQASRVKELFDNANAEKQASEAAPAAEPAAAPSAAPAAAPAPAAPAAAPAPAAPPAQAPAATPTVSDEHESAKALLDRALARSGGGVPWPHARLMVKGPGGVGKSSTIDAMAGKEFDAQHKSTVGAGAQDVVIRQRDLEMAGSGSPLNPYASDDPEYALALAAAAASYESGDGPKGESMLASVGKSQPQPQQQGAQPHDGSAKAAVAPSAAPSAAPAPAAPPAQAPAATPTAADEATEQANFPDAKNAQQIALEKEAGEAALEKGTAKATAKTTAKTTAPKVSTDLVIKARQDNERRLVLRIDDTGGQPIFMSVLELLIAPRATVYMVVFSLKDLRDGFEGCAAQVVAQLQGIHLFAAGAPIILTGTRKDEVGEAALAGLSVALRSELDRRCKPAIAGLVANTAEKEGVGELCFFAIENSRGYKGDESIRRLVAAIEGAAHRLPSMRQLVPLGWLRVYDEFRQLSKTQRRIDLATVRRISGECGMPHDDGVPLESEIEAMLGFFHSLNAVLWNDSPELRDLVVLDSQWLIDATCSVVRDYKLTDHTKGYARMASLDQEAVRKEPEAWEALTDGRATLAKPLLNILWNQAEFEPYKAELLDLMQRFGLFVPIPNKPQHWLVPTLLKESKSVPPGWLAPPADAAQLACTSRFKGRASRPTSSSTRHRISRAASSTSAPSTD